jgi:DNA-directed RNA polymerase specialized sigma24 family protein
MPLLPHRASAGEGPDRWDPRLQPFLHARDDREAERHLEALVTELKPLIQRIIRRRGLASGGAGEAEEDLLGETWFRILRHLQSARSNPAVEPIRSLDAFASVTTERVCQDHLRRHYPRRAALRSKLLDLLNNRTPQSEYAVWDGTSGERLCGFEAWRGRKTADRNRCYL